MVFFFFFLFSFFEGNQTDLIICVDTDIDCTDVSEGAKVGQKRICKGFPATLIVPSAHLIFQEDSIRFFFFVFL